MLGLVSLYQAWKNTGPQKPWMNLKESLYLFQTLIKPPAKSQATPTWWTRSASWFMPETTSIQIVLASRQCTRSDDDIQSAQINCRPFDSASYGIGWAHALTSYVANIVFIMAGAIDTRYLANQKNVSPTLYWSNHLQFSSNKPFMVKTPALGNMVGEWMPEFCGHLAAHSMLLLLGFRKFFTVSPLVSYLNPWWSSMMFQSASNDFQFYSN